MIACHGVVQGLYVARDTGLAHEVNQFLTLNYIRLTYPGTPYRYFCPKI